MDTIEVLNVTQKAMLLGQLEHRLPAESDIIPKDPLEKLDIVILGLSELTLSVQKEFWSNRKYNDRFLKISLVKFWLIAVRLEYGITELPDTEYYSPIFKEIDEKTVPYWTGDIMAFDVNHLKAIKEIIKKERDKNKESAICDADWQRKTDKRFEDAYREILEIKYQYFERKETMLRAYA